MLTRPKRLALFATALLGAAVGAQAGQVRLSFLDEPGVVEDTIAIIRAAGCNEEAIAAFGKALEWYNSTPPALDVTRFPQKKGGFHAFDSMSQLVTALPRRL